MTIETLLLALLLARGGDDPDPPPSDNAADVTLYNDDPAAGRRDCVDELRYYPPGSRCHVEPESAAVDLDRPWSEQETGREMTRLGR